MALRPFQRLMKAALRISWLLWLYLMPTDSHSNSPKHTRTWKPKEMAQESVPTAQTARVGHAWVR